MNIKQQTKELFEEYRATNNNVQKLSIRDQIFELNEKLIYIVIRKFKLSKDKDWEDYENAAKLALLKFIPKYAEKIFEYEFSTCAMWNIMNGLRDLYIRTNHPIKMPMRIYELRGSLKKKAIGLKNEFSDRKNKILNKITDKDLQKMKKIFNGYISYESLLEKNVSCINQKKDPYKELFFAKDVQHLLKIILNEYVNKNKISERDKKLFLFTFFGQKGCYNNYDIVGKKYDITKQRVKQIIDAIIRKLKKNKELKELWKEI